MAKLIVIAGPMFSGKSDRLIDFLNHQTYADQRVLALKPLIDNRTNSSSIATRSKNTEGKFVMTHTFPAISVDGKDEIIDVLKKNEFDVLAFDEAQFFPNDIVDVIADLLDPNSKIKPYNKDLEIYVAGLDKDFRRVPFGPMPYLLVMADEVIKTSTICFACRRKEPRAIYTQRIGGGDQQTEVGNDDKYQARCRECHYIYTPKQKP